MSDPVALRALTRWWIIASPEYQVYHASEVDPPEYGRAVLYVRARTQRRAKVLAVQTWRRSLGNYTVRRKRFDGGLDWLTDGGHPFRGVTATPVDRPHSLT